MMCRGIVGIFLLIISYTAPAFSVDKRDILGSYKDWDALKITRTNGSFECYMLSSAKSWKANKSDVSRGDIYITITHRPAFAIVGEVNVNVGYPLRQGSELILTIDGASKFELFSEGNSAWGYDAKQDARIIAAFKKGSRLTASASSQRGTRTTDSYSLSGFTAAYNAITKACR